MIRKVVLSLVAVLGLVAFAVAQNQQVSGTVIGADGHPVVGASVLLEGSTNVGTSTGVDGGFTLRVPANAVLAVSCMGYQSERIPVNGQTFLSIKLEEDTTSIDDVIVVAFGTAKKEAFTGSATVVKSEDISKVQTSNVAQALAGKVAGVQMTNSSGAPGSAPSIRIRGFSSVNAGQAPLYIVDGMPYEGDLNNLNPADIESMTVQKDAASNALYGARGANGVIMITTKRAKAGDAIVNIDAKWGVNSRALQTYDYIDDPAQYYETHFASLKNYYLNQNYSQLAATQAANTAITGPASAGGLGYQVYTVPNGQMFIGTNGKINPNATLGRKVTYNGQDYWLQPDDWIDEAFRTSLRQEYNVSVSGATDRSNFFASFGYLNDEGIVKNSDMERYTARLRADYQAKKWLKVGANVGYANFNYNSIDEAGSNTGNIFASTSTIAPIYPVYLRDGNGNIMVDERGYKRHDYGTGENGGMMRPQLSGGNPLLDNQLNTSNSEGNAVNGSGFFDVTFLKDFKFTFNAGMSLDETRSTSTTNPYYGQYTASNGIVSKQHARMFSLNLQQLLSYNKHFLDKHTIDVMIGHEYNNLQNKVLSAGKSYMAFYDQNQELNGAIIDSQSASSYMTEYLTEGYFGRVQYDYKEKIFVSGSYRRDASSRFHPDNRWGNFWSLGAAWLINKEDWFNAKWVDMLKVKASIGSQGNDNIGAYRYTDLYTIAESSGELALQFLRKGNSDITWETNTNFNVGVDFELFKGRLSGSVEYFNRKTTDMLFYFTTAPSIGYGGYYSNIGDMRNSGIELALNATLLRTKNVQWDFNLNMTHYKNKITKLSDKSKSMSVDGHGGYVSGTSFFGEDLPLYTFYTKQYAGVDPTTGLSMWWQTVREENPEDPNNPTYRRETTTEYSNASDYLSGNPIPDLYGGFGTNVSFYGFDLSVNFTYQIGGLVYDSGYASSMNVPTSGSTGANIHKDALNAWTAENSATNVPRWVYNDRNVSYTSDRFLVDASYLNIQNLQFGYTLPSKITRKFGVQKLRVYLACDNVYYWSYREGLDPRYSFSGSTSSMNYSPVRTISGGINVTF